MEKEPLIIIHISMSMFLFFTAPYCSLELWQVQFVWRGCNGG